MWSTSQVQTWAPSGYEAAFPATLERHSAITPVHRIQAKIISSEMNQCEQ